MRGWSDGHKWLVRHGDDPPQPADRQELAFLVLGAPYATTDAGSTLMHFAAVTAKAERLIPVLVRCGVPLLQANLHGATPLHWAACNRQCPRAVEVLLQARVNALACDARRQTALHYAAECGLVSTARLLVHACPWLLDLRDEDGVSPLGVAVEATHYRMVKALRRWGTRVTMGDLEEALLCGSRRMFHILLRGNEKQFPARQYEQWGQWAQQHHHVRLARYLFSLSRVV